MLNLAERKLTAACNGLQDIGYNTENFTKLIHKYGGYLQQ